MIRVRFEIDFLFLWPVRALGVRCWEMDASCLFLWFAFGWKRVVWLVIFVGF